MSNKKGQTFAVGFGAALNQPDGILGKLATRFNESSDLIHFFLVYVRESEIVFFSV